MMRLNRLRLLMGFVRHPDAFPFGKRGWTNGEWFVKHGLFRYTDYSDFATTGQPGQKWHWTPKAIESMEKAIAEYEAKRGGLK